MAQDAAARYGADMTGQDPKKRRGKLRTIEALRGVAAFSVVLSHVTASLVQNPELGAGHLRGLVLPGGLGVEFFFTLSGFVMAMTHGDQIGQPRAVPGFLWTRLRRLYPLLWVVLGLQCLLNPGVAGLFTVGQWINWITLNPAQVLDLISVLWTLKLEVCFYGLLALAMLPVVGRGVLVAWVLASPVLLLWGAVQPTMLAWEAAYPLLYLFLVFSPDFLLGFGFGFVDRRVVAPGWVGVALAAAGVALIGGRLPFDGWGESYGPFGMRYLYGVGFGAILIGCAAVERAGLWRPGWVAGVLGALSYPIYLSHLVVLDWLRRMVPMPRFGVVEAADSFAVLGVVASLGVGAALAYGVDRPLQALLRGRRRSVVEPGGLEGIG